MDAAAAAACGGGDRDLQEIRGIAAGCGKVGIRTFAPPGRLLPLLEVTVVNICPWLW